eukprot:6211203-Pleurochrysis_carterae.AAC.2
MRDAFSVVRARGARPDDGDAAALRLHGRARRLRLLVPAQKPQGRRVEEEHHPHVRALGCAPARSTATDQITGRSSYDDPLLFPPLFSLASGGDVLVRVATHFPGGTLVPILSLLQPLSVFCASFPLLHFA